jgi:hypothetical protein
MDVPHEALFVSTLWSFFLCVMKLKLYRKVKQLIELEFRTSRIMQAAWELAYWEEELFVICYSSLKCLYVCVNRNAYKEIQRLT